MAEADFRYYFTGDVSANPAKTNYERYGVPGDRCAWARYHERFDLDAEPNGANRYGWMVEVDPLDPTSTPAKRTALARFEHECAEPVVDEEGRLVIYSGDDQRQRLVRVPGQLLGRPAGPPGGDHRPGRQLEKDIRWRRRGCPGTGDWGQQARYRAHVLPCPGRRRSVWPVFHAERQGPEHRGSTPDDRWNQAVSGLRAQLDVRGPGHPLAGFQGRDAAAALAGRHHQGRRRRYRQLSGASTEESTDPRGRSRLATGPRVGYVQG
jgi:hypothetical protein